VARLYLDPPAHATELYSSRQPRPARDAEAGDVAHRVDLQLGNAVHSLGEVAGERGERLVRSLLSFGGVLAIAVAGLVALLTPVLILRDFVSDGSGKSTSRRLIKTAKQAAE
jgi:hypothetical protein